MLEVNRDLILCDNSKFDCRSQGLLPQTRAQHSCAGTAQRETRHLCFRRPFSRPAKVLSAPMVCWRHHATGKF